MVIYSVNITQVFVNIGNSFYMHIRSLFHFFLNYYFESNTLNTRFSLLTARISLSTQNIQLKYYYIENKLYIKNYIIVNK